MPKDLNWRAFKAHEDQAEYGNQLFMNMTMTQRLERFFALLEIRSQLLKHPKITDNSVFNLTK